MPSTKTPSPSPKPGNRPRWMLHVQAQFWRVLMGIGMMLHRLARPRPRRPAFNKDIDATVSPLKGKFRLNFYVPKDYKRHKKLKGVKRYPVVINFHGGGFVLGTAHDDARWCNIVVEEVGAVVVSVDYRLAPEYPFPTAVEDGADAILWLAQNAEELMLDPDRFAVSGFSSGGNMSFTVPLCLQGELFERTPSGAYILDDRAGSIPAAVIQPPAATYGAHLTPNGSRVPLVRQKSRLDRIAMLRQTGASSLSLISSYKDGSAVSVMTEASNAIVKIRGIVSFYPPTDYTQTRAQRRATCVRADQQLPAVFTELFDDSYLQPPSLDLAHPWLSPGVAPKRMLEALPDDIVLFCCEWDMLLAEGERFRDTLSKDLGKRVHYHCVPGVPHGWDKAPNPLRESPGARQQYLVACKELKRMFEIEDDDDDEEHDYRKDLPCRQYHKSVDLGQHPLAQQQT
ncbi:alpha/beta-hydrolase [Cucurbitaria berberidis CBS 394.84]|uniref:Alpha/beta-hydrolase n=1 Tax=Cucurbitaria berberidis CBS 394.84 TaxID=1168544 RepID=A0A9P4GB53_9PLEO|nr:alpha/beta-hydrolase [Cucurbitaria berberidis CBS 394.84]KAF1842568.1 alpha/beta-hydrolase [Cucurbitaria berberidis CBS 394.84]